MGVPVPFVEEAVFFSNVYFCLLCWKSDGCICISLFLGLLFHWLHVCFYASTMLYLLLFLCTIVQSLGLYYIQYFSYYSGLLCY
jgi:hypothetical protein